MEKILIIQLNRMGDCVQTLPLIHRLREQKPKAELTLFCVEEFSGFFKKFARTDRIVLIPAHEVQVLKEREESGFWENCPELHEEYDRVVNITNNKPGVFFSKKINGKIKSGFVDNGPSGIKVRGDWARYLFASQKDRQANLFNLVEMQIGMAGAAPGPVLNYMPLDSGEVFRAYEFLKNHGYQGKGKLVALQLGASKLHRAWPVDSYVAVADSLLENPGLEVVLIGSPAESELSDLFLSRVSHPVINLVGKTRMEELPGILKACDLIVSNDTGPIHIAAAVGTRALGIYFSTAYFGETAPFGPGNVVLMAEKRCYPCDITEMCTDMHCRETIDVESVRVAAEMMLDGKEPPDFRSNDLLACKSSFLSNGTLVYAPIRSGKVSERWLTALIWHSCWCAALGLGRDEAFLRRVLTAPAAIEIAAAKIHETLVILERLKKDYAGAEESARLARIEFAQPIHDMRKLAELSGQLQFQEQMITAGAPPIIRNFHMLALEDLDYSVLPETLEQLQRAYARLGGMTGSMIMELEVLRGYVS